MPKLDTEAISGFAQRIKEALWTYAPHVLGGVALLILGWLAARIVRGLVGRILKAVRLDSAIEKTRIGSLIGALGEGWSASRVVAQLCYITLLLLTLNTVADYFELEGLQAALAGAIAYLPKALAAIAIFAGGTYLGSVAKRSVGGVLRELRNPAAGLLETATEAAAILISSLVALDVLGADLSFIVSNLTMLLGALLVVVVFLSCWSMRRPAQQLVANYYLRRMLSVGDHVSTKTQEGTVLEFQPLGLIVRDAKGDEHFILAEDLLAGLRRRQGLTPD